jgi:hypothetical protein
MKRRLILNALLFCVSTSMVAQTSNKLTLDAQMQVNSRSCRSCLSGGRAPGINVVAAVSRFNVAKDKGGNPKPYRSEMTWQGFPYNAESGTSMAAPTVAGTIALWLEANPKLTRAEVKDIVCRSARTDEFTQAKPDQFGKGKIDAKSGLEMALNSSADIKDVSEGQRSENNTMYDLQGRPCSQPRAKGIYINKGKKIIIH